MTTPVTHTLANGSTYNVNPVHRNKTPGKSQWTITSPEEAQACSVCIQRDWVDEWTGWGLHYINGSPQYLGVGQDHVTLVFIAKFVSEDQGTYWHGYPAHHSRQWDRPAAAILAAWLRNEVLPAAKIRKVSKGEPCKL
jgi:hypothetical protein